jgi:hypothetical protein
MKLAIIGTRRAPANISVIILRHLPENITEIVSGGTQGVDQAAEELAAALSISIRRFLPDYARYGRNAPLKRNVEIIEYADEVLAFWDGSSHGTKQCIIECINRRKPIRVIPL